MSSRTGDAERFQILDDMKGAAMAVAEWTLLALVAYLATGLAFGLAFVWRGVGAVDPAARGMSLRVRGLILPGAAALWPWLLLRWLRRQQPPVS